jgi:hypothetical protein
VKVEENKETLDLISLQIRVFLWNMSRNPTNLSPNLAGVLYFGIFFKKLYFLYIGTEGVIHKSGPFF